MAVTHELQTAIEAIVDYARGSTNAHLAALAGELQRAAALPRDPKYLAGRLEVSARRSRVIDSVVIDIRNDIGSMFRLLVDPGEAWLLGDKLVAATRDLAITDGELLAAIREGDGAPVSAPSARDSKLRRAYKSQQAGPQDRRGDVA